MVLSKDDLRPVVLALLKDHLHLEVETNNDGTKTVQLLLREDGAVDDVIDFIIID